MLGYLRTWSASKRFEKRHGEDPVERICCGGLNAPGAKGTREVRWPSGAYVPAASDSERISACSQRFVP